MEHIEVDLTKKLYTDYGYTEEGQKILSQQSYAKSEWTEEEALADFTKKRQEAHPGEKITRY